MRFVERDGGLVVGAYARPQPGRATEALADDHPDILAYHVAVSADDVARGKNRAKIGDPDELLLTIVEWIEANPGVATPAMTAAIALANTP